MRGLNPVCLYAMMNSIESSFFVVDNSYWEVIGLDLLFLPFSSPLLPSGEKKKLLVHCHGLGRRGGEEEEEEEDVIIWYERLVLHILVHIYRSIDIYLQTDKEHGGKGNGESTVSTRLFCRRLPLPLPLPPPPPPFLRVREEREETK